MDDELRRRSSFSDDGLGLLEEELLMARCKAESLRCQAENDALRTELKASHAQHAEALRTAAAEWVRQSDQDLTDSQRRGPPPSLSPLNPSSRPRSTLPSPTTPSLHLPSHTTDYLSPPLLSRPPPAHPPAPNSAGSRQV